MGIVLESVCKTFHKHKEKLHFFVHCCVNTLSQPELKWYIHFWVKQNIQQEKKYENVWKIREHGDVHQKKRRFKGIVSYQILIKNDKDKLFFI